MNNTGYMQALLKVSVYLVSDFVSINSCVHCALLRGINATRLIGRTQTGAKLLIKKKVQNLRLNKYLKFVLSNAPRWHSG